MLTVEQFQACFPGNTKAEAWTAALNPAMDKYAITGPLRTAAFLAQCGHESMGFVVTVENLNYSAKALLATWPNRFTPALAEEYARQPERIANKVYANRMGNGDEASGDGWLYRGAGPIQITGHDNHTAFVKASGQPFGYVRTIPGGAEAAGWFWDLRNLNPLADAGDMLMITKKINGGINGLDDRMKRYEHIMGVLA